MSNLPVRTLKDILDGDEKKLTADEKELKKEYMEAQKGQTDEGAFVPQPMKIEIAHAMQLFKLPDEGKTPPSKEIELIILGSLITRTYWEPGKDAGTLFCSSIGGMIGKITEPGSMAFQRKVGEEVYCMNCTVPGAQPGTMANEYSSAEQGKGKACKEMRKLLTFHPAYKQGLILVVPPSSIVAFDKYMTSVNAAGKALAAMKTKIKLEMKSAGKLVWSLMNFTAGEELGVIDLQVALAIRKQYKEKLSIIEDDDYISKVNKETPSNDTDDDLPF